MKTEEYLKVVQEKITGHWTRGALFRDSQNAITLKQSEADKYCVLGAFLATSSLVPKQIKNSAFAAFIAVIGKDVPIDKWNDSGKTKESDVICAFQKAREIAKEKY